MEQADSHCEKCSASIARAEDALAQRDAALLQLSEARERLNQLRLEQEWLNEETLPLRAGVAWPLRYRVADRMNDALKRVAPGILRWAKIRLGK
jgi:hypothetical protein